LVPVKVQGITSGATAVASGYDHTCAVVNGGVLCWGYNNYGQLGNNSTAQSLAPVQVQGLTSGATAIAAGNSHACAVSSGGAVQCWGYNNHGQLGNNSTAQSSVPVQVQGLTAGATAITAGSNHTCAVLNGSAYCWGWNSYINGIGGMLGNGTTIDSSVPVQVTGLTSGVQAIAAGTYDTCAVVNGSAYCWGDNAYGALGNNSTVRSLTPVQVQGVTTGATAIAAGGEPMCAVVNGSAYCWGGGALGNNSTASSSVPVQVQGLTSGVQAIATGYSHACAVVNGRAVWCWGANDFFQLGNNSTANSLVPVLVPLL
jgi:alpha-tubulin suppressor-like RCC1 family protein